MMLIGDTNGADLSTASRSTLMSDAPAKISAQLDRWPRWPSGKASASRAEDPGFESRLRQDFFGVKSYH